jgi:hypothetical protein
MENALISMVKDAICVSFRINICEQQSGRPAVMKSSNLAMEVLDGSIDIIDFSDYLNGGLLQSHTLSGYANCLCL